MYLRKAVWRRLGVATPQRIPEYIWLQIGGNLELVKSHIGIINGLCLYCAVKVMDRHLKNERQPKFKQPKIAVGLWINVGFPVAAALVWMILWRHAPDGMDVYFLAYALGW